MESVGVREARQHLSRYLERVRQGESFTVTDHGHPVAVLAPIPRDDDPLAAMVAAGLVDPPKGPLPRIRRVTLPPGPSLDEILDELREDRI